MSPRPPLRFPVNPCSRYSQFTKLVLIIADSRGLPRCLPAIVAFQSDHHQQSYTKRWRKVEYTLPDIKELIFKALTDRETRVLARSSPHRRDERASQEGGDETGESAEQILTMRTHRSIETMSERRQIRISVRNSIPRICSRMVPSSL